MRSFSITYPQLMHQARALGLGEGDILRLHRGHDLALRLVDGLYRKQGVPFLCHLIRTASITMAERRPIDVVLASMFHAVYFLHCFEASGRRGPRRADRAFLRREIGTTAEHLVDRYPRLAWNRPGVIAGYARDADRLDAETRELLLMKLANELEDHMDAAPAFLPIPESEKRYARHGDEYVQLARALGHGALADELEQVMAACRTASVPASVVREATGSYELRSRLWLANPLERLGSRLRRFRARG